MADGALRRAAWQALLVDLGWTVEIDAGPPRREGVVLLDATTERHAWLVATIDRFAEPDGAPGLLVAIVPGGLPGDHLLFHALDRAGAGFVLDVDAEPTELDLALRGTGPPNTATGWRPAPALPLTATERRVAAVLAGCPDSRHAMARDLGIATSTLDVHVQAIKGVVRLVLTQRDELGDDGALTTERLGSWLRDRGYGTFASSNP